MTEAEPAASEPQNPRFLAIVLAGGQSRRMAGGDKLALEVADRTLLDHAVDAVRDAELIVAVGPQRQTKLDVSWTREVPPGGGPVAAIAAGLSSADGLPSEAEFVAVLAGDMPFAGSGIDALASAVERADCDVAIAVGDDGTDQPLLALWRRSSLSAVLARWDSVAGRSARSLLADVNVARVPVANDAVLDCDVPQDLDRVVAMMRGRGGR